MPEVRSQASPRGATRGLAEQIGGPFVRRRSSSRAERHSPRPTKPILISAVLFALFLPGLPAAESQTGPPLTPGAEESVAPDWIQARKQEVEAMAGLDPELKQKALQTYDQAQLLLDSAAKAAARAGAFQQQVDTAPAKQERLEQELKQLKESKPATPVSGETLGDLKTARVAKETELAKAKEDLAEIEAEVARRVATGQDIPTMLAEARTRLEQVEGRLRTPFSPETPGVLAQAQLASLLAEKQALESAITAYEKELLANAATTDLLPLEQRLAAGRVARLEEEVKTWRQEEGRMAEEEAKRTADEARRAAIDAAPGMKTLANENQEFAELAESLATKTRVEIATQEGIRTELERIQNQFQVARDRVATVGLTDAIGQLLRTQKSDLPDVEQNEREAQVRQGQIRRVQMKLFELEDRRSIAHTLDQQVEDAIEKVGALPITVPEEELESSVRDYLVKRDEYLDSAIKNHFEYLRALGDSEVLQRQLIQETEDFSNYIDERVLWIQSAGTLRLSDLRLAAGIVKRGACPEGWLGWADVMSTWWQDCQKNGAIYLVASLLVLSWFVARRRIRRYLGHLGEMAATSAQVRIWPTVQALLATALFAAAGPGLLFFLGIRLTAYLDGTSFVRAVGLGMVQAAEWWFPLALLKQLCRPKGLAELHFGWPSTGLLSLRRHLRWFTVLGTPLVFLMTCLDAQGIERWQNSLGRITFVALMAAFALFAHFVLRASGRTFRHFQASKGMGWLFRSRRFLHWCAVGTAMVLSFAALFGYYYTAFRLGDRVRETVLLVLTLAMASALLSRWILVVRRRLAIERMRQRRAAELSDVSESDAPAIANMPTVPVEHEVDLATVSEQTRRFVNSLLCVVGILLIWWVWIEVLPALAFLDRVPLWTTTRTITERTTTEDGIPAIRTSERPGFVSLADLGVAAMILLVTAPCREEPAGPSGDFAPAEAAFGRRCALRDYHADALRGRWNWCRVCLQRDWFSLVAGAMACGRPDCGPGLRSAGDLCQFHFGPDPALRAADSGGRRGHDRRYYGGRESHSDEGDNRNQLGPQGLHRSQQGVHHGAPTQLDAFRSDQSNRDQHRRCLWLRHRKGSPIDRTGASGAS